MEAIAREIEVFIVVISWVGLVLKVLFDVLLLLRREEKLLLLVADDEKK